MKNVKAWVAAGALVATAIVAVDVIALPRTPLERKEDRKERRETRREIRSEWREQHKAWVEKRQERRKDAIAKVKERWGKLLENAAAREELRVHARRTARLERMKDLAEASGDDDAKAKVEKLIADENARHEARMTAIKSEGSKP
ncbi:MAG: hypothetical protein U0414_14260 [Polyangiaceae bacterium]